MSYYTDITLGGPVPVNLRIVFLYLPPGDPGIPSVPPVFLKLLDTESNGEGFILFLEALHEGKNINLLMHEELFKHIAAHISKLVDKPGFPLDHEMIRTEVVDLVQAARQFFDPVNNLSTPTSLQ